MEGKGGGVVGLLVGEDLLSWRSGRTLFKVLGWISGWGKLQALVYDILPSTSAVFSYAIGSR